jgi:hypothetical protein
MSENCPRCGSNRASEFNEWFLCDSVVSLGALVQSEECKDRELAALRSQLAAERQLKEAAEAREAGLEEELAAAKEACVAGRALPFMVSQREGAEPGGPEWTRWDNSIEHVFNALSAVIGDVDAALLAPAAEEGAGDGK